MFRNIITALLISVSSTAFAADKIQPVVIAGGAQGGGYNKYAIKMSERMKQRGYDNVTVTENNGSDAITLAACNGKADIWIAQIDAIYTRFNEGCQLAPVADYGTEYAMLFFPPDSRMDSLDDLTDQSRIAIDGIGSGTELFWKTIVYIETGEDGSNNDWAKAIPVESTYDTLNTSANFGDIDAAILVRSGSSDQIKLLLDQGWTLGYLYDKDIDDQEFNTKPLYSSEKITIVNSNGSKQKNWGYGVRSFIGVTKKAASDRQFKVDVAASTQ